MRLESPIGGLQLSTHIWRSQSRQKNNSAPLLAAYAMATYARKASLEMLADIPKGEYKLPAGSGGSSSLGRILSRKARAEISRELCATWLISTSSR